MASRGDLDRPHVVIALARQIAIGETSTRDLAEQHGCSMQAIRDFGRRYHTQVLEIRRNFEDALAGIAYAPKIARIAALSDIAENGIDLLRDPNQLAKVGVGRAELMRAVIAALRGIADEKGEIPQKVQVQMEAPLALSINGVDLNDLR